MHARIPTILLLSCAACSNDPVPVDAPSIGCMVGSGPTLHPGSINSAETWTAAASPHVLQFDTTFYAAVTLEPCVELRMPANTTLTIRSDGKLIAEGTAARPIHITSDVAGQPFSRIASGNEVRLAYVTIDGGGARLNGGVANAGVLDLQGDQTLPTQGLLHVDHVTISGSADNGVILRNRAGFSADSTALTITGSAQYPVALWEDSVGTLPPGSYTGNAHDEILLAASNNSPIVRTTTMHDRGVPYRVGLLDGQELRVGAPPGQPLATLTIEPGAILRFNHNGVMQVQVGSGTTPALGALIAAGTAERPIVFTSGTASPAAGDWYGVWFGFVPDSTDIMDHVRVEDAGGASVTGSNACPGTTWTTTNAAIRISGPPTTQFVTNSVVTASAAHGIDRGWRADTLVDFLATNTFTDINWCFQTYPRTAAGVCPAADQVPCPR